MAIRKPMRHVEGRGWEVLFDLPPVWIACDSQDDAELIAGYEIVCDDVFAGLVRGEEIASRLETTAAIVIKQIGHGTVERYIRYAAIRAVS